MDKNRHPQASHPAGPPVAAEPVAAEPAEAEPEPVEAKRVEGEPAEAEPEPVAAKPVETKPVEAEPVTAEPITTEPVATEPPEAKQSQLEQFELETGAGHEKHGADLEDGIPEMLKMKVAEQVPESYPTFTGPSVPSSEPVGDVLADLFSQSGGNSQEPKAMGSSDAFEPLERVYPASSMLRMRLAVPGGATQQRNKNCTWDMEIA